MNKTEITFGINNFEFLVFELLHSIKEISPFQEITIKLRDENNDYVLSIDCIKERVELLYNLITDAIEKKAQLDESITNDIGYLWNEEMQNKPGLSYFKIHNIDYWVGLRNLLWSTPSNQNPVLSTWIYNDCSGAIIIEITPSYPWHSKAPKRPVLSSWIYNEKDIQHEEWLKTYKPLIKSVISKDTAVKWKNQAKYILDQLNQDLSNLKQ